MGDVVVPIYEYSCPVCLESIEDLQSYEEHKDCWLICYKCNVVMQACLNAPKGYVVDGSSNKSNKNNRHNPLTSMFKSASKDKDPEDL